MARQFDPRKFIDRKFEQELFERLLRFENPHTRILAVRDAGGMGKTQLLEKLKYRCQTVTERTPVSLVSVKELETGQPIDLVRTLADEFSDNWDIEFPTFRPLIAALDGGEYGVLQAHINLQNANLSGAEVRFTGLNIEKMVIEGNNNTFSIPSQPLVSRRQISSYSAACMTAFLDDLKQFCAHKTVVIMIDHFEECSEDVSKWIRAPFLLRSFFNREARPERLLLVVAGRSVPAFETLGTSDEVDALVSTVHGLGAWKRADLEECLKVYGYHYDEAALDMFCSFVSMGSTPATIVNLIEQKATLQDINQLLAGFKGNLVA